MEPNYPRVGSVRDQLDSNNYGFGFYMIDIWFSQADFDGLSVKANKFCDIKRKESGQRNHLEFSI